MKKKIMRLVLICLPYTITTAQTFWVSGRISTSTEVVKNASITFTNENDTTKSYSTTTDSLGNYSIGLITSIKENTSIVPTKFELAQNYPNPFSSSTAISYKLNRQSEVNVTIYDILGREVKKFSIGEQLAGIHGVLWDGRNNFGEKVTTGIYFYRLQAGKESQVNKMVFARGSGISNNFNFSGNFIPITRLGKETTSKITPEIYTIKVANTDSTNPKIEPLTITDVSIAQDTTINIYVQKKGISIYVMEKDHLFGSTNEVDIYHEILIINTSTDSVCFNVESPIPDSLRHESVRSPSFGRFAIIPTPYQDYFDLPNINNSFYTDAPDSSTDNCYIWKDVKLGPSDLMEVPYSNFYGEDGKMFIEKLGTSRFLYMDIVLDCSIERDSVDSRYLNIEIKETAKNITNDALSRIGIELFVPRELLTKFDPYNPEYTKLYNLVSDTVISPSDNKCYLSNRFGTNDGFGFFAEGQEMNPSYFILPPHQSYEFVFKMKIEPLLDKFEIYPTYGVTYITTSKDRIWPGSIITLNNNKYQGEVHYLKELGLVMPPYILFSINKDTLRVVSPDDIVPTFTPDY